jgi:uncharacterized membrane protein (DUF373 family)
MKEVVPGGDQRDPGPARRRGQRPPVPHTQIHAHLRQVFETLQDVVVTLLLGLLLVLSLLALWRIAQMAFVQSAEMNRLLSEILYVLILTEVYRLLNFYLREHRVSVALVSTFREVILRGAHKVEWPRITAISLLLVALGGLLALERWMGRWREEAIETDAS